MTDGQRREEEPEHGLVALRKIVDLVLSLNTADEQEIGQEDNVSVVESFLIGVVC